MKSSKHLLISTIILFVVIFSQFVNPQTVQAACAPNHIIYVRSTGTNAGGCSWATAFTTLQSALAIATSGDQIWVATGTYYPDEGTGQTNNAQISTYLLTSGVSVYGGFNGTETQLTDRNSNPATNGTTLSGDIDQDGLDADNAFSVVTVTGILTDTFILDGFTITNGYEDSGSGQGGGIYVVETNPTLENLIVTNNFATSNGGGIYMIAVGFNAADETTYNRPTLTNVTISSNTAARGGGIYTRNSSPTLTDVTFSLNTATGGAGGGMNNQTNSTSDAPSVPRLNNVTFNNNTANGGGGIFNGDSNSILTNVTFSQNTANIRGGAVLNEGSNPVFRNVSFSGNTAPVGTGGAIRNVIGAAPANKNSNPFIYNSILWGDIAGGGSDEITSDGAGVTTITDSVVENGCQPVGSTCTNIITTNPNLGALLLNTPGLTQTMAIGVGSSAIDTGNNTTCAATDQRGITRPQGPACDIGAYEFQGATTLTVSPATGIYGNTVNLTATLESGGVGVGGRTINFTLNGTSVGSAITNGSGVATLSNIPLTGINVGTYLGGVGSGIGASFAGDGTYNASSGTATLTVNQRAITVTAVTDTKVYDGNTTSSGVPTITSGTLAVGDTVTWIQTFNNANVGVGKTLTPAGTVTDGNGGNNYAITFVTDTTGVITARALTITADAGQSKVYGNADPLFTYQITAGTLVAGDSLSGTLGRVAGENVGNYAITQSTLTAGTNYTITFVSNDFIITTRPASVTPNDNSKAYGDLDPAPLTTGTLTGFLPADNVTATYTRAAGETIGTYTISATLTPAGVLGNYNITYNTANFTITGIIVTPTITANDKVYDGNNTATFTCTLTGVVGADDVNCSGGTATFADQNVGTNKLVTATGLTLSGADIANYTLAPTTATDTANITARTLNVAATGINKPYDGNTTATVTLGDDRLVGDILTLNYTLAAFIDPNVGTGKIVNVSGISISGGADAGNYSLASTSATTTADITAIVASVTPNNAGKAFGAADPIPLTTGTLSGFIAGDGITATYTRTAGEAVGPYTISANLSPASVLGNYNITYNTATFTIGQATPTITWSNPANITYGTALSGTQLNTTAAVPGTFTYTPSAGTILNAGNGQNLHVDFVPTDAITYTNASADVTINVNKAVLTVVADNQSINFGDPDPAFTFTYSAFVPGDTAADIDTPPTCTVSGSHTNVGTYPITCSGGTDNNYSFSYVNGTLSVGLASQTITINIPAPGTTLFPGNSFTVAATASSGLPVMYSASGSCTNSGATFTMTAGAPGICTVIYNQPGNANYGPAPQLTETVGIALVVTTNGINSNTDTGDGQLAEFEAASVAITQLTVNFNKDVDNPAGNTLTDDVTNPANYILVADNGDGIQTSACNVGVTGGDLVIPVNTVAYNNNGGSGPFASTLGINGGGALPIGTYRLVVCGTTSIVDLTSTPLAGNGLASGTDFIRNFSVTNIASIVTASTIPDTGFPQNKITTLPIQPADKAYASTDLWIEIPKLGVKTSIVGVPQTKAGWDVTWLDQNAGWLNGSAFPTWKGNSVITAHVWDALNKPGLFAGLKELKYGDQIKIHAFGQIFTYELRESTIISPTNINAMLKHEEKSWLTLITCEDYKELTQKYPYRRMVRAVLVSVTAEK